MTIEHEFSRHGVFSSSWAPSFRLVNIHKLFSPVSNLHERFSGKCSQEVANKVLYLVGVTGYGSSLRELP
jgi:hypothetical protein